VSQSSNPKREGHTTSRYTFGLKKAETSHVSSMINTSCSLARVASHTTPRAVCIHTTPPSGGRPRLGSPAVPGQSPAIQSNGVVRGHEHGTTPLSVGGVGCGVPRRHVDGGGGRQARAGAGVRRTGLTARDLRALDPNTASSSYSCYPSSSGIAARDRAVVISLDGVRAVVTATEVLVPGPQDPAVAPLVRELPVMVATGGDEGGLPFEFRALEACLQLACKSLEHEVRSSCRAILHFFYASTKAH
jgi:hypothetical protein